MLASHFVEVFSFLGVIERQELQHTVRQLGGAAGLLHHGPSLTNEIRFRADFEPNGYDITLGYADDDSLFVADERVYFQGDGYDRPYEVELSRGQREAQLSGARGGVASWVDRVMRSWVVFHFHDTSRTSPVKRKGDINDNRTLRPDGSNLAALLYRLRQTDDPAYHQIVDAIRLVAPFFDDFVLQPDRINEDVIQLAWHQRGSDAYFGPAALSDGTLRFMCIATLLLQPEVPSLVLLDEPELGLHPYAIHQLGDMLRTSASQMIVSTQSVTLLDQMDIDDILIAEQADDHTQITRPERGRLKDWLADYSVGELWEKNLIGGRPTQR